MPSYCYSVYTHYYIADTFVHCMHEYMKHHCQVLELVTLNISTRTTVLAKRKMVYSYVRAVFSNCDKMACPNRNNMYSGIHAKQQSCIVQ